MRTNKIRQLLNAGHFRIGDDMAILKSYWQKNGEGLRKLVS